MSRAVRCDACGALVAWIDAVVLEAVGSPIAGNECRYQGWSDIEICRAWPAEGGSDA